MAAPSTRRMVQVLPATTAAAATSLMLRKLVAPIVRRYPALTGR